MERLTSVIRSALAGTSYRMSRYSGSEVTHGCGNGWSKIGTIESFEQMGAHVASSSKGRRQSALCQLGSSWERAADSVAVGRNCFLSVEIALPRHARRIETLDDLEGRYGHAPPQAARASLVPFPRASAASTSIIEDCETASRR